MGKRSCPDTGNVSFPLKTTINNLQTFYDSIKGSPNIYAEFNSKNSLPLYINDDRSNGEINESSSSMNVTYNNIKYNLINAQICLPTHTDWLLKYSDTPILNKIDFIVTLENVNYIDPRFVIMVIPLVMDTTLTYDNDNIYLTNLAQFTSVKPSSLEDLFNGLTHYFYYTTCLEPNGDNAFVYVNLDCIKISEILYYNLLALWTNTDIEIIQQNVKDNIIPPFKKTLNKQIHSTSEIPIINNNFENWPRYAPPYDIILNVTSRTMKFNIEPFQSSGSDNVGSTTTDLVAAGKAAQEAAAAAKKAAEQETAAAAAVGTDTEKTSAATAAASAETAAGLAQTAIAKAAAAAVELSLPIKSMKCVPLDIDNVIDSNGNINFDSDGNIKLSDVQAQRQALRQTAQVNKVSMQNLQTYFAPTIAILLILFLIMYVIIPNIPIVKNVYALGSAVLPDYTGEIGFYGLIALIFAFSGFLIGAAVTSS